MSSTALDRRLPVAPSLQPPPTHALRWTVARGAALVTAAALVGWLVLDPSRALRVFWYALLPLLPATFFLTPALWRAVCPLATLNELGNRFGWPRAVSSRVDSPRAISPPAIPPRVGTALNAAGLVAFYLLVPARHFLLGRSGVALAVVIVTTGAVAVVVGSRFPVRSAFCNALCPILPAELLYGMAPLAPMGRRRCATCTVCTPRGCFDLAKDKTVAQRLGPARQSWRWVVSPYGAFFAAFPGFILGYNQLADGPLGTAPTVYATVLAWSLASWAVIGVVVGALRAPAQRPLSFIAASSGAIYYWFAGPSSSAQFGGPVWLAPSIRTAGIGTAAVWLVARLSSPANRTTTRAREQRRQSP